MHCAECGQPANLLVWGGICADCKKIWESGHSELTRHQGRVDSST